jgi:hypothetical protein
MSLRRWRKQLGKKVSDTVSGVKEKASEMMSTETTLETAKEELINDLEKGLRIFDEIGLPQDIGDDIQEDIANYAMKKLEENFPRE